MNFFSLVTLSENTVSQWLRQNKEGVSISGALNMSRQRLGNIYNPQQKEAIAKWCVFRAVKDNNNGEPVMSNHYSRQYFVDNEKGVRDYTLANWQQIQSRFNDQRFTIEDLVNASEEWHDRLAANAGRKPGATGETIIDFGDGWKWVKLPVGYCDKEAESMGHCGNAGAKKDDRILSLRDAKNIPYLTFIWNGNELGEMKGRANEKPAKRYHKYIIRLLESDHVGHLAGGGYAPENNFKLEDLEPAERQRLLKMKPGLENFIVFIKGSKIPHDQIIEKINERYNLEDDLAVKNFDDDNVYFKGVLADGGILYHSQREVEKQVNAVTKLWLTFISKSGVFTNVYTQQEYDREADMSLNPIIVEPEPGKTAVETYFVQQLREIKLPISQEQAQVYFYFWKQTYRKFMDDSYGDEDDGLEFLMDFYLSENNKFLKQAKRMVDRQDEAGDYLRKAAQKPLEGTGMKIGHDGEFYMDIEDLPRMDARKLRAALNNIPKVSPEYKQALIDMYIALMQWEIEHGGREYNDSEDGY